MAHIKEGQLIGSGAKFGIVVARFNEFICSKLLGGAYMPSIVTASTMTILRRPGFREPLKSP